MKTAMIWGAQGEIGRAILKRFEEEEWSIILAARNLVDYSAGEFSFDVDFQDERRIQDIYSQLGEQGEEIDVLVYAGGDITSQKVAEMPPGEWGRIMNSNLTAPYLITHYALPVLSSNAHLFYVGAISEKLQLPGLSAYAAAKAGLEAFATALKKEERKKTITVIRPSAVATSFWDKVPFRTPANALPPEAVAERVWEAYQENQKGLLDLLPE